MRRLALGLLLLAVLAAAAAYLAGLAGSVRLQIGGWVLDTTTPVAIIGTVLALLAVFLLARLVGLLLRLPRRMREGRAARRRDAGDDALTRTLVALAGKNSAVAVTEATRARKLLNDAPLALAVAAEAHRLAGQKTEARARFATLAAEPRTAMIGLRGLVDLALEASDAETARSLLERARYLDPGSPWLKETEGKLKPQAASPLPRLP